MLEQEKKKQEEGLKSLSHLKDQLKDVKSTRVVSVFHGECDRMNCCTIREYRLEVDEKSPLRDGDYAYEQDIKGHKSVDKYSGGGDGLKARIEELKGKK